MKNINPFADAITNVMTTAAGLSGNTEIALSGAAIAPFITRFVIDMGQRGLSAMQSLRCNWVSARALHKSYEYDQQGKKLRDDSFMIENEGEQAVQIIEGLLLKAKDEYERKKVNYYANLLTNVCYHKRIIFEQAISITHLIEQLSYRQFTIIAYAYKDNLATAGWEAKFKNFPQLSEYNDLYSEILSLYNTAILYQVGIGATLGGTPYRLSELGKLIYEELDLQEIPESEVALIGKTIQEINDIMKGK